MFTTTLRGQAGHARLGIASLFWSLLLKTKIDFRVDKDGLASGNLILEESPNRLDELLEADIPLSALSYPCAKIFQTDADFLQNS